MKQTTLPLLACPGCGADLRLSSSSVCVQGAVQEGQLGCQGCAAKFPITNFLPRFVESPSYASSFGFQWNKFSQTQIDKFNGTNISLTRFREVTGWSEDLRSELVVEAGCGAGRFTQIALETGAEVFSFDLTNAVDANQENNGQCQNLSLFQADLYHIPLKRETFDKIFCFGTLQHCPDPRDAFLSLLPCLKRGGEVVIDVYRRQVFRSILLPKSWIRPVSKRLPPGMLFRVVKNSVPVLLPIKVQLRERIPALGRVAGAFIPVPNYKGQYPLSDAQLVEWATLDTFDMLGPTHVNSQNIQDVRNWFGQAGLQNVQVSYGPNGIIGRGTKP